MRTCIRQTITKSLILLLAIIALASCSKERDSHPDEVTSGDLLLVEEKVNGQTTIKYEYDERNRTVLWEVFPVGGGVHIQRFSYDNNDRLIAHDRRTEGKVYLKESYAYENSNQPVSGIWTYIGDNGQETIAQVLYTYGPNSVTETVFMEGAELINTYTFDNQGNAIRQEIGQGIVEYDDYDDKPSLYTRHPWPWKIKYTHNYRSVKTTSMGIVAAEHVYEYTYNAAGYPTSAKVYDRKTEELVETHEYFYKKAN